MRDGGGLVLTAALVAEVVADTADGSRGRRGSGYLVTPGRVLTAAHIVGGASGVRVRFQADRSDERVVEARIAWMHQGIDIAVLAIEDTAGDTAPVSYGRLGEQDVVVRCTALGFPRFKLRTDEDGSRFRDAEHLQASCAALSNRREGTLDLSVDSPPPDGWEGMSGAAVFSSRHLIGVVTRHHLSDGPGRIAAGRVDRWAQALTPGELDKLEEVLKTRLRPPMLPDVIPPTPQDLRQESYRAYLGDFAPTDLKDRRSELASLVEFCGGSEPYLWIQGPPWAGKTALVAWFALHPPRGVIPVWHFVTARYAGQADSRSYFEALLDQLAAIAGREPSVRSTSPAHGGELSLLLRQAAERAHGDGRTLLLVVDGLDEDQSLQPTGSGPSIASLLPERLPPGVRLLVTSRPGPGVPADVAGNHPLRTCRVLSLTANAAALHTEHEARHELRTALSSAGTERDLVALFTAAGGPLKVEDLCGLTGEPEFALRHLLDSRFGRILQRSGSVPKEPSGDSTDLARSDRGHVLAHETLLVVARREFGQDLAPYRERLHAWAAAYARQGWPSTTPAYLLQPYGRMAAALTGPENVRLAVALATDPARHARLHAATQNDAACLAEIAAVHDNVRRSGTEDLNALTTLAVAGDLLARRNEELHLDAPAVYGRLGRVRFATGLARSVFHPLNRGIALAKLARAVAESGDRRAVGLAEEAVRLIDAELGGLHPRTATHSWWRAKGIQAGALAATGQAEQAVLLLSELPRPSTSEDATGLVTAVTLAAEFVRDAEAMDGPLRAAEGILDEVDHRVVRAELLAGIAQAWADCNRPQERDRVHDTLLDLVRSAPAHHRFVPVAVNALRPTRPEAAQQLLARALGEGTTRAPGRFARTPEIVYALVATRSMDEVQRLLQKTGRGDAPLPGSPETFDERAIAEYLAEGWAREGGTEAAWNALAATWSGGAPYEGGGAATVAGLLAEAGRSEEAEAWLATATDIPRKAAAEALSALALHHVANAPERALRLLELAVHGFPGRRRELSLYQQNQFVELAAGMASAGRRHDAERLVAALTDKAVQARGWSVVSLAVRPVSRLRALRFARRALSLLPENVDSGESPGAGTAVAQALMRAGAVRSALRVFTEHAPTSARSESFMCRMRIRLIPALWAHDPRAAGRMADEVLRSLTEDEDEFVLVAELLAAIGHRDAARASAVTELLTERSPRSYRFYLDRSRQRWRPAFRYPTPHWVDLMLACLLEATTDPDHARRDHLDPLADEHGDARIPAPQAGAFALAYTALDDHDAAAAQAGRSRGEIGRAEVRARLAAYAACLPTDAAAPLFEGWDDVLPLFHRLTSLLLPPPSGPDIPRAQALLTEALTAEGWHHAVPVLTHLAPEALLRAGEMVLAELDGRRQDTVPEGVGTEG
ncbi:hypothetical protein GCM10010275_55620 [Streptomyces litmocidini]|uniref:trypsin-like peptidase domain-containing protein n=1 Tax=Streptomyces litmocidini TaxID=67318 RepID=UPI00167D549F|nr:trypsin-like peptidase domain-containing protein [Streptomyces litmocidini]GGV08259.1 hypothetical protein GCM10010275_55620 [Streptomyces litmocidini]